MSTDTKATPQSGSGEGELEGEQGSPFCKKCGSCGEPGCDNPGLCEHVRCLYPDANAEAWRELLVENEQLRSENARLKREMEEARTRSSALHRRAQKAEAALAKAQTQPSTWESHERQQEARERDVAMDAVTQAEIRKLTDALAKETLTRIEQGNALIRQRDEARKDQIEIRELLGCTEDDDDYIGALRRVVKDRASLRALVQKIREGIEESLTMLRCDVPEGAGILRALLREIEVPK